MPLVTAPGTGMLAVAAVRRAEAVSAGLAGPVRTVGCAMSIPPSRWVAGVFLAALTPGALAAEPVAPSRLAVREGRFVDKATGTAFIPLGANYYRTGKVSSGKVVHATFCPGFYDRAYVEAMMPALAAGGFSTVRTFLSYHVGPDGILTSPQARELAPEYLAHVVHFLHQARRHGLHVIFSWDVWIPPSEWWSTQPLPDEARYGFLPETQDALRVNNVRLALPWVRTRANGIVALIEALKKVDAGLLPVVMAWELENEVFFAADQEPFARREGSFAFAGRSYDLASDAEVQALMDAVVTQWVDLCAGAVRQADPEALVSAGLFSFAAVGRKGPGTLSQDQTKDGRVPARPLALLRSSLDYVDLHLYAWRTPEESVSAYLERNLRSVEWDTLKAEAAKTGKPIFAGETGIFANYLRRGPDWQRIDHDLGLACFREQVQGLRAQGFVGALYWHYGSPDSMPGDESPVLALFPQYAKALREAWPRP